MADINLIRNLDSNLVNNNYTKDTRQNQQTQSHYQQQSNNYSATTISSSNKDAQLPTRIGNYILKKKIGSGNFAIVKLAEHLPTKAKVAVKIIDKRKMNNENLNKIRREIEIMKKIDHKNIIKLYQVIESEDHIYLITDYCEGGELFDYLISNGRLKENQARKLFNQILDAIEYLHSNSVVHRDLKAENLLLSDDKTVIKVADFGFSNYYRPGQFLNTFCGSLPYASPELFQGIKYNGYKSDIWSLGVVLYALVCGGLPFGKENLHDLKTSILSGTYRIPFFLSEEVEELIKNMLVVEADRRFTIQQVKAHKWVKGPKDEANYNYEINQTIGGLDKLNLNNFDNNFNDDDDQQLYDEIANLAAKFNLKDVDSFMNSVKEKKFDDFYALYHLTKDYGINLQSPSNLLSSSSPLLPVIAAGQHRKSSITTGTVERENSDEQVIYDQQSSQINANLLNATLNQQRRHTFGPESSSTTNLNKTPVISFTPPHNDQILLNSCDNTNLAIYPSNVPLQMDLLKPPPIFHLVTNNMMRRASDGQANYFPVNEQHFNNLNHHLDSDENDYSLNGSNSELLDNRNLTPNNIFETINNQFRYSLNDQADHYLQHQQSLNSTPSPAQFNGQTNQINSPLYFQQQQQQQLLNNTFSSSSSPYHSFNTINQSSYLSNQLDLKDKTNYLNRRKRHSLTDSLDISNFARRKIHQSNSINNNNSMNNIQIQQQQQQQQQQLSNNNNLMPGLGYFKDLNRRRASEGSGQLLQQLTANPATMKRLEQLSCYVGNDLSILNQQLIAQNKNLFLANGVVNQSLNSPNSPNNLNFLSNSSINQLKQSQQQNLKTQNLQKAQLAGRASLCVSSPPSLQTSPIRHSAQQTLNNHLQQSQQNQLVYQKSQSPPVQSLQMISEEQPTSTATTTQQFLFDQNKLLDSNSNLNSSPTQYVNYCSAITPPQSFRTPTTNDFLKRDQINMVLNNNLHQHQSTPSIVVTDAPNFEQATNFNLEIIPAPMEFAGNQHNFYKLYNQSNEYDENFLNEMNNDHHQQLNSNYNNNLLNWKEGTDGSASLVA